MEKDNCIATKIKVTFKAVPPVFITVWKCIINPIADISRWIGESFDYSSSSLNPLINSIKNTKNIDKIKLVTNATITINLFFGLIG